MIKTGDTVRYLNAKGGGVVRRIEGKIAYVDEDGFEQPVLVNELVVIMPAGFEKKATGPNLFFDQAAVDAANSRKGEAPSSPKPQAPANIPEIQTPYGNKLNIALAFEPSNIRELSKSDFNAVLVNDSNYFLLFSFMRRSAEEKGWTTLFAGELAPNELMDVAVLKHGELNDFERVAIQYVAFKKDKEFEVKQPALIVRKLDLTKFFKLHSFRPGIYFEAPVMEISLVKDDNVCSVDNEAGTLNNMRQKPKRQPAQHPVSPTKLLPVIEIDLHAGSLLDTTAGMEPKDILLYQLDTVRKVMKENAMRKGQKIVFIHGKGDGVLRKGVRDLLKKEYPHSDIQDASFQEYGFGATLVTIHT